MRNADSIFVAASSSAVCDCERARGLVTAGTALQADPTRRKQRTPGKHCSASCWGPSGSAHKTQNRRSVHDDGTKDQVNGQRDADAEAPTVSLGANVQRALLRRGTDVRKGSTCLNLSGGAWWPHTVRPLAWSGPRAPKAEPPPPSTHNKWEPPYGSVVWVLLALMEALGPASRTPDHPPSPALRRYPELWSGRQAAGVLPFVGHPQGPLVQDLRQDWAVMRYGPEDMEGPHTICLALPVPQKRLLWGHWCRGRPNVVRLLPSLCADLSPGHTQLLASTHEIRVPLTDCCSNTSPKRRTPHTQCTRQTGSRLHTYTHTHARTHGGTH